MAQCEESGGRLGYPTRFRLRRTLYELRLVDGLIKDYERYGSCDPWNVESKRPVIRIDSSLKGRMLLDTLLHEMMHAWCDDIIKEWAIEECASDMARILVKLFPQLKELTL